MAIVLAKKMKHRLVIAMLLCLANLACGNRSQLISQIEAITPNMTIDDVLLTFPKRFVIEKRATRDDHWVDRAFRLDGKPTTELLLDDGKASVIMIFDESGSIMGVKCTAPDVWPLTPNKHFVEVPQERLGGPQNSRVHIGSQNMRLQEDSRSGSP
jgi:hypothetical protein